MTTAMVFESRDSILRPLNEKASSKIPVSAADPVLPPSEFKSPVMEQLAKVTHFELEAAANSIKSDLKHYSSPSAMPFAIEAIEQLYISTLKQLKRCPIRLPKANSLESPGTLLKIDRKRQDLLLEVAQYLVNPKNNLQTKKSESAFSQALNQCWVSKSWASSHLLSNYPVHCESLQLISASPANTTAKSTSVQTTSSPWTTLDSITKLLPEQISRPWMEPSSVDEESLLETIEQIESQLSRLKEQVLRYRNQRTFQQQNIKRNINPFEEMI